MPFAWLGAALLVFAVASAAPLTGTWTVDENFSPRDKFFYACNSSGNGTIYVAAGRSTDSQLADGIYRYDVTANVWTQLFPSGYVPRLFGGTMQFVRGRLYAFGGDSRPGVNLPVSNVYTYDPADNALAEVLVVANTPSPRARLASWVRGNRHLFIYSGRTQTALSNELWSFDTVTSTWTHHRPPASPHPRFNPCCSYDAARDLVFCFGGTTVSGDTAELWQYNHTSSTWTLLTYPAVNAPTERRLALCSIVGDEYFVWGGWDSAIGSFIQNNALHRFNLRTGVWTQAPQPEAMSGRDSGGMCAVGAKLFVFGGATTLLARDSKRLNDLWHLDASTAAQQFDQRQLDTIRPPKRAYHSSVVIARELFVLFGRDQADAAMGDVWIADLEPANTTVPVLWREMVSVNAGPAARYGAGVAVRGYLIFVFGGRDATQYFNDLFVLNTQTRRWAALPQPLRPVARAFHMMAFHAGWLVVAYGENATSAHSDMALYDFEVQSWRDVAPSDPATAPEPRTAMFVTTVNSTHSMMGAGFASQTFNDRWVIGPVYEQDAALVVDMVQLNSTIPAGSNTRSFIRAEAAVAGFGARLIVCGGSIANSFPASPVDACYQYDAGADANERMSPMPRPATGATGVTYRNKMIIFGGQLASSVLQNSMLDVVQIFTYDSASICAETVGPVVAGGGVPQGCAPCGRGSSNRGGAFVPCPLATPGNYIEDPFAPPEPCASGTLQRAFAAQEIEFCIPCAAGTVASSNGSSMCDACRPGQHCPMGSSVARRKRPSVAVDKRVQPTNMTPMNIPTVVILLCLVGALFYIFVAILLVATGKLDVRCCDPQQTEAERIRRQAVLGQASVTVREDDNDNKIGAVHVPTPLTAPKGTRCGGAIGAASILCILLYLTFLLLIHVYDNMEEVKMAVPLPVIETMFPQGAKARTSTLSINVTIVGPRRQRVSALRASSGACVRLGTDDECVGSIVPSGIETNFWNYSCYEDVSLSLCSMRFVCIGCHFANATNSILFRFPALLSAEEIAAEVTSGTGIYFPSNADVGVELQGGGEQTSSVSLAAVPNSNATVFSGFDATVFSLTLVPTFSLAPNTVFNVDPVQDPSKLKDTGYHVTPRSATLPGNAVGPELFDQFVGVPIEFQLTNENTGLLVERRNKAGFLDLLSNMLGSMPGIAAIFAKCALVFALRREIFGLLLWVARCRCCEDEPPIKPVNFAPRGL